MRHHTASARQDGTGWHYVSMGRQGGHPLGYCADHAPHSTEDEARECYGMWQRDHITLTGTLSSWSDCLECGAPTKQYASIEGDGYALAPLCAAHLDTRHAAVHLHITGPAGDSWQS